MITVTGYSGLGKSILAKAAARFLKERNKFSDGIIYVDLQTVTSADGFVHELYRKIKK